MTYTHHTEERDGLTLKIMHDPDRSDMNPARDDEHCVRFAMLHGRYANPAPELRDVEAIEEFEAESRKRGAAWIAFPVFMYEHSGRAFSLRPFACPWDSGRVGTLFLKRSEFSKPYRKAAEQWMQSYSDWAEGNIWGFVVEDAEGDHLDSCWGFIGDPDGYVLEEGRGMLAYHAEEAAKAAAVALEAAHVALACDLQASRPDLYGSACA